MEALRYGSSASWSNGVWGSDYFCLTCTFGTADLLLTSSHIKYWLCYVFTTMSKLLIICKIICASVPELDRRVFSWMNFWGQCILWQDVRVRPKTWLRVPIRKENVFSQDFLTKSSKCCQDIPVKYRSLLIFVWKRIISTYDNDIFFMHIAMRSAHYPVIKFCNCKFFRLFDTNRILSSIASEEWNQKTIAYTKRI